VEQLGFFPEDPGLASVSQAAAMSALVKMVRLRRTDDAVYWFLYFASRWPEQRFRLSRRVLIIAAEDNLCVPVQVHASDWFARSLYSKDVKSWAQGGASIVHLICATDNWWKDDAGSHYILSWRRAERIVRDESESGRRALAEAPLDVVADGKLALVKHFAKNSAGVWFPHANKVEYARWLVNEAMLRGDLPARLSASIHSRWSKFLSFDDNYLGQALYRLVFGPMGYELFPRIRPESVYDSVQMARARLLKPEFPPAWTQDGIHTGGSDRRFAGVLSSMVACCNAYRHFGRLDPADQHEGWMYSTTRLCNQLHDSVAKRGLL
jgi:hypothetical protein